MNPIYIILLAVIVTMLLTVVYPRLRPAGPAARRFFWIVAIIGGLALLAVAAIMFMR